MRKAFIFILVLVATNCFAQFKYPDYPEVHYQFNSKYTAELNGEKGYVDFAKKQDGWYVQFSPASNYKIKTPFKCWDKKSNKWEILSFKRNGGDFEYKEPYVPYMYRVSPLFGYNGWYNDVIDSLGNKSKLTDTLLYALSKAYFNKLAAAFGNQYGDYEKEDVLKGTDLPNTFTNDDLMEIGSRYDYVAKTTKRMQVQNPDFETFIGSLPMQYGNDVMDVFMRMYLYHNKEEANKYLEKNLYDPFVLDFARYYLYSCPANAIIFTNGDNDTYPLWYAQYVLGIRTDVSVVNTSLLNYPEYAMMIRKTGLVNFSVKDETLLTENFGFVYVADKNKKMGSQSLFNFLKSDFSGTEPKTIDGGIFAFNFDEKEFNMNFGSYIYSGDLVLMDIIYTNMGKRPVCFTAYSSHYNNMFDVGLEFSSIRVAGASGSAHGEQLLKIWEKDFSLSDYSTFKGHFSASHHRLLNTLAMDIAYKVKYLIKDGKMAEAKMILNKLNDRFSPSFLDRDRSWIYVAADFGKLGEKSIASTILDQVIVTEKKEKGTNADEINSIITTIEMQREFILNGTFGF